jgi:gentisate 1,2-dioxygenase
LQELAEQGIHDPCDGVLLEYKNPINGGPTFLTMSCHLQMLMPGQETRFHRHTGTTLYHTVKGQGLTVIDQDKSIELAWDEHDSFNLPSWRWHKHRNRSATEPAIVFSLTDRPVLQMTGLDREELG